MTQNLRIQDKTVFKSDTDIEIDSFVLPASNKESFITDNNHDTGNSYAMVYIFDSILVCSNTYPSSGSYNRCAATGGEICSNGQSYIKSTHSICPKGWRLPEYAEYSTLRTSYVDWLVDPVKMAPAGRVYRRPTGIETEFPSNGMYRTDTGSSFFAYGGCNSNNNNPNGFGDLGIGTDGEGHAIRCISR